MQLTRRRIISIGLIAIVCLIFASAALGYIRLTTFKANYESLRNGDSKQVVVDKLGQPQEIHPCRPPGRTPCSEEYSYFSFMERWIIYIDENGSVVDKSYGVSY